MAISDTHVEIFVRQMLRWVKIEEVGDTSFLLEHPIDKFRLREDNERVFAKDGRPANGRPLLLGIAKALLSTDSFISAASFQETTRVLSEASINGSVDSLRVLKENVIVGRLIPGGYAWGPFSKTSVLTPERDIIKVCHRRTLMKLAILSLKEILEEVAGPKSLSSS